MKSVAIEGKSRSEFGKKSTRQLRSEGEVPCVIYGGDQPVHFSAPKLAFRPLVYTPDFQLANITVDGKTYKCIMKDLQFDVITDELSHVDFLELVEGRKIIANLPLKFVGQPGVIETEQLQHRGVQVVDVHLVFCDVEAQLVGLPDPGSGLDSAAGHPHGECVRMMIAAVGAALHHRSPAEFAAPDHQRIVQQSALF